MPKSSKRFTLHTDSLNSQGFRMLTAGCDLSDFEKNPVMLFNHILPEGNSTNQVMPIGHWEDIELTDDKITAVPVFDDNDEFAMSIYNKVEAGVMRMCSVGAEPMATSNSRELIVDGQELETVTEWKMKEASICAFGANPDALAVALYDNKGKITLSESSISIIQNQTMATKKKAAAAPPKNKKAVTLADDNQTELEDDDPEKTLADDEGDDKDKEIALLKAKLKELEEKLADAEEQMKLADDEPEPEEKATKLADAALKLKKITLKEKAAIIKLAIADYDATLEMLKARKAHVSVKEALEEKPSVDESRVVELSKKSFDELFTSKTGDLEFLKLNAPDVYKAKYKMKFGKEPKNV